MYRACVHVGPKEWALFSLFEETKSRPSESVPATLHRAITRGPRRPWSLTSLLCFLFRQNPSLLSTLPNTQTHRGGECSPETIILNQSGPYRGPGMVQETLMGPAKMRKDGQKGKGRLHGGAHGGLPVLPPFIPVTWGHMCFLWVIMTLQRSAL